MLSSFCLITSLVSLVSTVASSALPSLPNLISGSLNVPATSHPLNAINASQQDLQSSGLSYNPECSSLYGFLNYASCQNALAKMSRATLPLTFGQRGTGNWDVVLPRRYLSGMLFPDYHECSAAICLTNFNFGVRSRGLVEAVCDNGDCSQ